jgi:hypothetical protein
MVRNWRPQSSSTGAISESNLFYSDMDYCPQFGPEPDKFEHMPFTREAIERKLPMLPSISFETGRKTQTQSSVQDHSLV